MTDNNTFLAVSPTAETVDHVCKTPCLSVSLFACFLCKLPFILRVGQKLKIKLTWDICKGMLDNKFEQDWSVGLVHGCVREAHCVTARWRNFSHYCCPLRHYGVFWAQRSTDRYTDRTRCTQTRVYSARGTTEQVGRLHYVTAVDGKLEAFPLSIVICAPVV